ncbi:MAG: ATP-binding protein [Pseudonocardia sp.]
MTEHRRRLPLRWRVAVAFALAASLVTGLLALLTWGLASDYMLDQRRQGAALEAAANVRILSGYLQRNPGADPAQVLAELAHDQDDTVALRRGGGWTATGRMVEAAELQRVLDELVREPGEPAQPKRAVVDGLSMFAVATPLPELDVVYLELTTVTELEQTLRFVRAELLVGIGASAVLGLGLGRWAGRQALRPLTELTRTAGRVAGGDLRARLPEDSDPDLAALAVTFNRTTAALERRVARDSRFAADVSHELRSPLTTMINASEVLNRRQDQLPPAGRHALRLLTADLERFRQMVTDLLEISRDDSVDDQSELCDFAELVRQTLAARHDAIPLELSGPHPTVLVDRRRLERAVANLLDNAARHAGGAVRVGVLRRGDRARLEVDDAGPGIPTELRREVFERFARGNRSGDRGRGGGSGLGLALVAQHVLRHGGEVWVDDRPDGPGARFVVELPIAGTASHG